jgi:hypothetical protein
MASALSRASGARYAWDMSTPNDASVDMVRQRDAFLERMLQSTRGTFELFSIYIGVRLGFYEALAAGGPLTSAELAARTATSERYAREWLEQQTAAGILEVNDEKAEAQKRRFSLPAAYVEVLVDQDSLNYLAPLARLVAGAVHPLVRPAFGWLVDRLAHAGPDWPKHTRIVERRTSEWSVFRGRPPAPFTA